MNREPEPFLDSQTASPPYSPEAERRDSYFSTSQASPPAAWKRRDSISRSPESELPKPVSFDISPDAPSLPPLSPRSTKGHSLLPIRSRSSKRGLARNPSSSSQLGIEQTVAQSLPRSPSSPPSSPPTNAARPISRQLTPSTVTNSFADVHTKASVRGPRSPPRPAVAAPPVSRTISSSRRTSGSSLDRPTPPSSSSSVSSNLPGGPSQFASSHAPDLSNPYRSQMERPLDTVRRLSRQVERRDHPSPGAASEFANSKDGLGLSDAPRSRVPSSRSTHYSMSGAYPTISSSYGPYPVMNGPYPSSLSMAGPYPVASSPARSQLAGLDSPWPTWTGAPDEFGLVNGKTGSKRSKRDAPPPVTIGNRSGARSRATSEDGTRSPAIERTPSSIGQNGANYSPSPLSQASSPANPSTTVSAPPTITRNKSSKSRRRLSFWRKDEGDAAVLEGGGGDSLSGRDKGRSKSAGDEGKVDELVPPLPTNRRSIRPASAVFAKSPSVSSNLSSTLDDPPPLPATTAHPSTSSASLTTPRPTSQCLEPPSEPSTATSSTPSTSKLTSVSAVELSPKKPAVVKSKEAESQHSPGGGGLMGWLKRLTSSKPKRIETAGAQGADRLTKKKSKASMRKSSAAPAASALSKPIDPAPPKAASPPTESASVPPSLPSLSAGDLDAPITVISISPQPDLNSSPLALSPPSGVSQSNTPSHSTKPPGLVADDSSSRPKSISAPPFVHVESSSTSMPFSSTTSNSHTSPPLDPVSESHSASPPMTRSESAYSTELPYVLEHASSALQYQTAFSPSSHHSRPLTTTSPSSLQPSLEQLNLGAPVAISDTLQPHQHALPDSPETSTSSKFTSSPPAESHRFVTRSSPVQHLYGDVAVGEDTVARPFSHAAKNPSAALRLDTTSLSSSTSNPSTDSSYTPVAGDEDGAASHFIVGSPSKESSSSSSGNPSLWARETGSSFTVYTPPAIASGGEKF